MAEIQEWLKATGLEMYIENLISDGWDTIATVILSVQTPPNKKLNFPCETFLTPPTGML